jgi:hypothetical protein
MLEPHSIKARRARRSGCRAAEYDVEVLVLACDYVGHELRAIRRGGLVVSPAEK